MRVQGCPCDERSQEGVYRQGCALHPLRAGATATAEAKAGFLWVGGVGPVAGDAVNPSLGAWPRHPCRGHSRNRTHPAFDRSLRSAVDPRHAWMNLNRNRIFRTGIEKHPRMAWNYRVDQGRHLPTAAGICQRWGGGGGGGGWVRRWVGVPRLRGFFWRLPPTPPPPRQPTECRFCCCCCLCPQQVQGCKPCSTNPSHRDGLGQ